MGYYQASRNAGNSTAARARQMSLFGENSTMALPSPTRRNSIQNKLDSEDRSVHDWYRFVLSFPPHIVASYIDRFNLKQGQRLLDPFCGTGTTLVEA